MISSSATLKLASTEVLCYNYYDENRGLVNRSQPFQIKVTVENRSRIRVDSVIVQLSTNGFSTIAQNELLIEYIDYERSDDVLFNITADPNSYSQ